MTLDGVRTDPEFLRDLVQVLRRHEGPVTIAIHVELTPPTSSETTIRAT